MAEEHRARLVGGFSAALTRARAQGEHIPADPDRLAAVLMAALIGVFATWRAGSLAEADSQLDGLIRLLKSWQ